MADLINEMQELDMRVASHQLLADDATVKVNGNAFRSSNADSSSQMGALSREMDEREKEIARTVLLLVQKDHQQVIYDANDDDCHSTYTADLILNELNSYEDDSTSIVSWRSQSSRKKNGRSRSSSSKSRHNIRLKDFVSTPSSHQNQTVKLSNMEESDRLYNAFMRNLSPQREVISRITRGRSVDVSTAQDLSLTNNSSYRDKNHIHENTLARKGASQMLVKTTLNRSSSAPATTKSVDHGANGFEDPFAFDPFGLKQEVPAKSNIDANMFSSFSNISPSEKSETWNPKEAKQPIRRYEFIFSETSKFNSVIPSSSRKNLQQINTQKRRHSNLMRQRSLTEETHPESLDIFFDATDDSYVHPSEVPSLALSKTTADDKKWKGFRLSANFASITPNWENFKDELECSPIEISDFPHPPSLNRGKST